MMDVIAWPLAAVSAFLIFLLLFRGPIAALIQRVRSIKRDGIETGPITPQSEAPNPDAADALMRSFESPMLLEAEKAIRGELKRRGLDCSPPAVDVLIRHLARAQMQAAFESLYRVVFGSQLALLREANTGVGISFEAAKALYVSVSAQNPEFFKGYSYSDYIGFMLNQQLVLESNGAYRSTIRGQTFLEWMVRCQLTEKKAF
jgi:hypothetical protein